MFAGLINRAKSAAVDLVLEYVARASVAVPFVIALAFAFAAITPMLIDRFGHVMAYWSGAAGLTLIGAIAALAVSVKEKHEEEAEQKEEEADTGEVVSDATAQAMGQGANSAAWHAAHDAGRCNVSSECCSALGPQSAARPSICHDRRSVLADRAR